MNLHDHYAEMLKHAHAAYVQDRYEIDDCIDSINDRRYGLTVLLRPAENVKEKIQRFLHHLRDEEPHQYFYPDSDVHVTVMSIVSCYEGFSLDQISVNDYVAIIEKSLERIDPFEIDFRGLTASPSCLMIAGYPRTDTLNRIRDNLRHNFRKSDLQQSIDKRYSIQTAHSTVFRLKQSLHNKIAFLRLLEQYHHHNFGTFTVDSIDFVYNDWYQRQQYTQLLHRFSLR